MDEWTQKVREASIVRKYGRISLRWFGYVRTRPNEALVRRVDKMDDRKVVRGKEKPKLAIDQTIIHISLIYIQTWYMI